MNNYDLVTIAGNRPEIIKLSRLIKSFTENDRNAFVYTGQHYSYDLRDVFLKELDVTFDHDLQSNTSQVIELRQNIRKFLIKTRPKFVAVYGDTNSSLAGALAAKDVNCWLIHIEAGLRNFNQEYVEERNRVHIDSISDYLLAPTQLNKLFLDYENVIDNVFVTGNLIVDICKEFSKFEPKMKDEELPSEYVLLTLHKPISVDDPIALKKLVKLISSIKDKIIFPLHPRTKKSLEENKIGMPANVMLTNAKGYTEFISLMKNCTVVMTDSGGVQEEAVILRKPCITLFSTTDRQESILIGANRLFFPIDTDQHSITEVIQEMKSRRITVNPYGEDVTRKVLETIRKIINDKTMKRT